MESTLTTGLTSAMNYLDDDGNLTSDGLWDYVWAVDQQNRLTAMNMKSGLPATNRYRYRVRYRYRRLKAFPVYPVCGQRTGRGANGTGKGLEAVWLSSFSKRLRQTTNRYRFRVRYRYRNITAFSHEPQKNPFDRLSSISTRRGSQGCYLEKDGQAIGNESIVDPNSDSE